MWLAAAVKRASAGVQRYVRRAGGIGVGGHRTCRLSALACREQMTGCKTRARICVRNIEAVLVVGHLVDGEGKVLSARGLAERIVAVEMHRNTAAQIRESEGRRAVAAIGCTEQRKKRRVLRNGLDLAGTRGPA